MCAAELELGCRPVLESHWELETGIIAEALWVAVPLWYKIFTPD